MRQTLFFFAFVILLLLISDCGDNYEGPRIQWLANLDQTSESFIFNHGVLVGVYVFARFEAIQDSGPIIILCKTGKYETTIVVEIEEGKSYQVKAKCGFNSQGSKVFILESESAENGFQHNLSINKVVVSTNGLEVTEL